jgi:hypothetical protein
VTWCESRPHARRYGMPMVFWPAKDVRDGRDVANVAKNTHFSGKCWACGKYVAKGKGETFGGGLVYCSDCVWSGRASAGRSADRTQLGEQAAERAAGIRD